MCSVRLPRALPLPPEKRKEGPGFFQKPKLHLSHRLAFGAGTLGPSKGTVWGGDTKRPRLERMTPPTGPEGCGCRGTLRPRMWMSQPRVRVLVCRRQRSVSLGNLGGRNSHTATPDECQDEQGLAVHTGGGASRWTETAAQGCIMPPVLRCNSVLTRRRFSPSDREHGRSTKSYSGPAGPAGVLGPSARKRTRPRGGQASWARSGSDPGHGCREDNDT